MAQQNVFKFLKSESVFAGGWRTVYVRVEGVHVGVGGAVDVCAGARRTVYVRVKV